MNRTLVIDFLEDLCALLREDTHKHKETLTVAIQITDDQIVKLKATGVDRDGVPADLGALTATPDDATLASVVVDPTDPTTFVVTPLPVAEGGAPSRTVNVTITDTANNISEVTTITMGPGAETAIVVTPTVEAAPVSGS